MICILVFDEKGLEETVGNPNLVRSYGFRCFGDEYRTTHIITESLENGEYPPVGRPKPFVRREGDSRQKGLRKRSISVSLVKNGKKRIFFACDEDADESY